MPAPEYADPPRIQFRYGTFVAVSTRPGWITAHVVFTHADDTPQAVQLRQHDG